LEQFAGEFGEPVTVLFCRRNELFLFRRQGPQELLIQDIHAHIDRGDRRTEFVRHRCDEIGLQTVQFLELRDVLHEQQNTV
jgi:hypothetical protein